MLNILKHTTRATCSVLFAVGLLVTTATTQAEAASITTLFDTNNGGLNGGAVYFDLIVGPNDITITGLDANTTEVGIFPGFEVYTGLGSAFGNETNLGFWTSASTGTLTANGENVPSPVALNSTIDLNAGTSYGIALVMPAGAGHNYTNTGDLGALASYANLDLTLNFGTASNVPFTGFVFNPRTWNGTIYYETNVSAVPLPAAVWMFLSALSGLGLLGWRRRHVAT